MLHSVTFINGEVIICWRDTFQALVPTLRRTFKAIREVHMGYIARIRACIAEQRKKKQKIGKCTRSYDVAVAIAVI